MKLFTAIAAIAALTNAAQAAGGSIDKLLSASPEEQAEFFRRGFAAAPEPINATLTKCGITLAEGQKPEEAIAAAIEQAGQAAGASATAALVANLAAAGVKITAESKPEEIKAALEQKAAALSAGQIAKAGLKDMVADAPPAASGDTKQAGNQLTGLARAIAAHQAVIKSGR